MSLCDGLLTLGNVSFACDRERDHLGLCSCSGDKERITDQVMIDEGRLHIRDWYCVTWLSVHRSSKQVGKDSPEWREALSRA